MTVQLLLGGSLRYEGGNGRQEKELVLPAESTVHDLLLIIGLAVERVKLILVNGRGATAETVLQQNDRVALFPPELSFNTFVSLSFRKEVVAARTKLSEK